MKPIMVGAVAVLVVVALVLGGVTVMADKPQSSGSGKDVIAMSNGFPSGPHFNLNIHGKKEGFICDPTPGGGSVFVSINDTATIQYVTNRKSAVVNLTVLDPCAVDGGTAEVQLPYEADGFFVFARILGTPGNKGQNKDGDPNSIILYPNVVKEACNWNSSAENATSFGGHTNCSQAVWPLGLIVGENVYGPNTENATFERFDPIPSGKNGKGKGRSKGVDITRLFTYSGWVVDSSLDIGTLNATADSCEDGPDGLINKCDVPADAWNTINTTPGYSAYDFDPYVYTDPVCGEITLGKDDGQIDIDEWLAFQMVLGAVLCNYYCETWILNIADLVVTEQQVDNDGAKLLQVRFYPVVTTEYIPPPTPTPTPTE